ncbi:MAG: NfeD family protein [Desulfatiglandales bacterium]
MKRPGVSARVVLKYSLLQIPGIVLVILILVLLQRWVTLPAWLFWTIVCVWIAKEVIFFPFVWRAYDSRGEEKGDDMIGQRGIAEQRLSPSGYVRVRGELWHAEIRDGDVPVERGEAVKVSDIRGLTLRVERDK